MRELPIYGLIPAAGKASRLGPLPCSKELLPTGFFETPEGPRPQVACEHLLRRLQAAGIEQSIFVLREEKLDIPRYLTQRPDLGMDLAYVSITSSGSVPESLDRAYPFVRHGLVALGFPDVIFEPEDAFSRLIAMQRDTGADVVLGLFPWDDPSMTDMVELGDEGRLVRIEVRPRTSELTHNWLLALWGPRFSEFLHAAMKKPAGGGKELQLGTLFAAAHRQGLDLRGVEINDGRFVDLGTPKGYNEFFRRSLESRR